MTGKRISIIDDDDSIRKSLIRLMKYSGWKANAFACAEDFLQTKEPPPDCLVIDVRLPGMSGLDLQRQLVANNCRVPLIFISSHGDEVTRQSAIALGACDFLNKPFDGRQLLEALSRAVAS